MRSGLSSHHLFSSGNTAGMIMELCYSTKFDSQHNHNDIGLWYKRYLQEICTKVQIWELEICYSISMLIVKTLQMAIWGPIPIVIRAGSCCVCV